MKYLGTVIGSALMLLITVPRHGGFMLGAFLIFLIPLFLYSGVRMYRRRDEVNTRGKQLAVWMLAFIVALAVNLPRQASTRDAANNVVTQIVRYHETNGIYPSSVEDLGYDRKSLNAILGLHRYSSEDGKPFFSYAVPYIVFDMYLYDFNSKQWVYSGS